MGGRINGQRLMVMVMIKLLQIKDAGFSTKANKWIGFEEFGSQFI